MNNDIFVFDGEKILVDIPEPKYEDYQLKFGSKEYKEDQSGMKPPWQSILNSNYKTKLDAYNSRPSYPVSDELKSKWVKGQRVVEGVDFKIDLQLKNTGGGHVFRQKPFELAIPLPEQSLIESLKQRFAAHLQIERGDGELNNEESYAVEWTVNELNKKL